MLEGMAPGAVTVRTFDVDEDQLASRLMRRPLAGGWEPDDAAREPPGAARPPSEPDASGALSGPAARAAAGGARTATCGSCFRSSRASSRSARRGAMIARGVGRSGARAASTSPPVPVGVMIEIPAAAYTADLLAREVDFFTIGTNDLIQYCLAVDRADERVSRLLRAAAPGDPADDSHGPPRRGRRRIPVSLCGEMASDPALLTLLVGLGLTEFSMTPGAIPVAKQVLSRAAARRAARVARRILRLADRRRHRARAAGRARAGWRSSRSDIVSDEITRVEKPWGYELHWAKTDRYVGKLIHVNAGHALSLQYHNLKDETIYLHSGQAAVRDRTRTASC